MPGNDGAGSRKESYVDTCGDGVFVGAGADGAGGFGGAGAGGVGGFGGAGAGGVRGLTLDATS